MKTKNDNINYKMQTTNDNISAMLQKLTDTGYKTYKHEEQLIETSSKLSNYEYRLENEHQRYTDPDVVTPYDKTYRYKFQDRQERIKTHRYIVQIISL